jgi:hypothetical protein
MNNLLKLRTKGTAISGAVAGIVGHHYGGKILSYREEQKEEQMQTQRDDFWLQMKNKLDKVVNQLEDVKEQLSQQKSLIEKKGETVLEQFKDELEDVLEGMDVGRRSIDAGSKTIDKSVSDSIDDGKLNEGIEYLNKGKVNFSNASNKLSELIDKINGKNNFIEESDLTSFYKYLDSLSLLEESALFHIAVIVTIMCIVWNIYSVIFANEFIKYFNLEAKYPRLNKFFKLRIQFQRYYLFLNLVLFLILSIFVLSINILVLA